MNKKIGLYTAVALVAGSMIGSGIFKKPGLMAMQLGSPSTLILVWVIAGLVTCFGALTNAEISSAFKERGGQYHYFNILYGDFVGYLYGWAIFAVIQTASIASIAYVFSHSAAYFIHLPRLGPELESFFISIPFIGEITPLKDMGLKVLTICLISLLTLTNILGVRYGGAIQVMFTTLKILALGILIFAAFFSSAGSIENLGIKAYSGELIKLGGFFVFIKALSGAFWAYDGWNNVTFVSGEIEKPQQNIPKALIFGTLTVMAIYILTNLAYIYVIPIPKITELYRLKAGQVLIATEVAGQIWSYAGVTFIALAIMFSTLGSTNGSILTSARVPHAMAADKMFFKKFSLIHLKFQTPWFALTLQGVWASILVLSGTFDQLTDMLVFVAWIFYALAIGGVFKLRVNKKFSSNFKMPGYPFLPLIFIIFSVVFLIFTLYTDIVSYNEMKKLGHPAIINSVAGLFLVLLGVPGYFYWKQKS